MKFLKKWRLNKLKKKANYYYLKRQSEEPSDLNLKREIGIHMQLVKFYTKNRFNKHFPDSSFYIQESYRVAAFLNDVEAQYQLSQLFFDKGKFWENMKSTFYSAKVHTEYMESCYKEAIAFLQAAEEQGYALALRLHGLALINGWGVAKDENQGFKYIVNSIDKEDSWSRATLIFEELGLNKPEFFTSLRALKKEKHT